MPFHQSNKPFIAHDNRTPKRNGRRAALRAIRSGEKLPKSRRHWPVYPEPITMRTLRQWGELA